MPCCIIAATFIALFVVRWKSIKVYLGFEVDDGNPYGWKEYCEIDDFAD
ncbi:MAG: hypothetical protein LBN99_06555 [Oscillospiraceae bacterium]|nr:hypothetical protein [Oscillospiraceae bacterium]